ncbi:MAG: hypothetical protein ABI193_03040 [Minicystis sp.]
MKSMMIALMMVGGLTMFAAGCGKDEKADEKMGAAASGESTGVAECDEYIKKMDACMGKVPAAGKPGMEAAFKATRDSFKTSGATPEGKAALKTSCKAMVDGLAQNPACK